MRKLLLCSLLVALIAAATAYGFWTDQRTVGHYLSDLRIKVALDQGVPGDRGNLLGVQPDLFIGDYQSPQRLHLKLAAYLHKARELGLLNSKTVVVLPEHIGSWLMIVGEKEELYQAVNAEEAMNWLMFSNPWRFVRALVHAEGADRLHDARTRMKAGTMARDYQQLFGDLAREFGVTLVAGSIVLPEPHIEQGRLRIGSGSLHNVSLVFGSDGQVIGQPQRQASHASAEAPALQVFQTPAGRLGVLIGSDSWNPDNYRALEAQGVNLIAAPASALNASEWPRPWNGAQSPTQASSSLPPQGKISEGEAWHRLTLSVQARPPVMTVFLHSRMWNLSSNGQSFIVANGRLDSDVPAHGARLLNVWLSP